MCDSSSLGETFLKQLDSFFAGFDTLKSLKLEYGSHQENQPLMITSASLPAIESLTLIGNVILLNDNPEVPVLHDLTELYLNLEYHEDSERERMEEMYTSLSWWVFSGLTTLILQNHAASPFPYGPGETKIEDTSIPDLPSLEHFAFLYSGNYDSLHCEDAFKMLTQIWFPGIGASLKSLSIRGDTEPKDCHRVYPKSKSIWEFQEHFWPDLQCFALGGFLQDPINQFVDSVVKERKIPHLILQDCSLNLVPSQAEIVSFHKNRSQINLIPYNPSGRLPICFAGRYGILFPPKGWGLSGKFGIHHFLPKHPDYQLRLHHLSSEQKDLNFLPGAYETGVWIQVIHDRVPQDGLMKLDEDKPPFFDLTFVRRHANDTVCPLLDHHSRCVCSLVVS